MSGFMDFDNKGSAPFDFIQNLNVKNDDKFDKLTGTNAKSKMSALYFSQVNVDYLQDQMVERIYKKSKGQHVITKQSEDELLIVMRSMYLQYGKNSDINIQRQINDLNERVLEYCVGNILMNIDQHYAYLNDLTKEQEIMDKPQYVHIKGEKSLMPKFGF
jgi:hypothetical protein